MDIILVYSYRIYILTIRKNSRYDFQPDCYFHMKLLAFSQAS
jgi:hypothetical protein